MTFLAEQIIPHYQRHGAEWSALRRQGAFAERGWLDLFVETTPHEAGSVLDLGCGGGEPIATYLAQRGLEVTGVDTSSAMLEIARSNLPFAKWIEADMRTIALGRRFGGIIAWDSFFHLTPKDQRAMFPVFATHAVPGAALMFTSGPAHGEAIGEFAGEPLYHASLDTEEYRALLADNGFEVVRHVAEDPECGGHTVWLCRKHGEDRS